MGKKRPLPADFAEQRERLKTQERLMKHYRSSYEIVGRWIREADPDYTPYNRSVITPEAFREAAKTMTRKELIAYFRIGEHRFASLVRSTGAKPVPHQRGGKHFKSAPDGFAEAASTKTIRELALQFRAGRTAVRRWIAELGVTPAKRDYVKQVKAPAKAIGANAIYRSLATTRTTTIYDDAADMLRRERWIVFRATENGKADPQGQWWRVGNVVVTPDELIQRAEKYRRRAA